MRQIIRVVTQAKQLINSCLNCHSYLNKVSP